MFATAFVNLPVASSSRCSTFTSPSTALRPRCTNTGLRISSYPSPLRLGNRSFETPSLQPYSRSPPRAELSDDLEQPQNIAPETTLIPETEALDSSSGSVIVPPTFYVASFFLFTGGFLCYLGEGYLLPGLPLTLFGLLLTVQTVRVRFVFGPKRFSVTQRSFGGSMSIIRGWEYEKMTNWEVWWKPFPVLAYFNEKESYNGRGSVHFFPMVCDGKELVTQFRERTRHLDKSSYDD